MPPELWADVAARFTKMRLGFSQYVRWLLERDLKERGVMVHSEDPGEAGIYPKHSPASLTLNDVLINHGKADRPPRVELKSNPTREATKPVRRKIT